jgi:hypothetical protein
MIGSFIQIVEIEPTNLMTGAADGDHSRTLCALQAVKQLASQSEVSKMIGAELHLKAINSLLVGESHHTGVVDQYVQMVVRSAEILGELTDVTQIGQI